MRFKPSLSPRAPVTGRNRHAQILGRALGHLFLIEIAPGIVDIAVAPVFGLATGKFRAAIRSGILRRNQAVERIIGKRLVAAGVAVVGDAVGLPLLPLPQGGRSRRGST